MTKILNKNGFTAIEMLVVAGIMVFLLLITIANFRNFEKDQVLETEADKLASVIRQAQIWALTGQTSNGERYNYGVHLSVCQLASSCQYLMFKDLNNNKVYDEGELVSDNIFSFLKGIYSESLSPVVSNELDVVFEPPLAVIYFNGIVTSGSAEIILKSPLTKKEKTIRVNRESGQINITAE